MPKKLRNIIHIFLILTIIGLITGCGGDDDTELTKEEKLEQLYSELEGSYTLYRSEITFVNEPKQVLEPPDAVGTMTITSDQRLAQTITVNGISVSVQGSFEINQDEGIIIIDNDGIDLISKAKYTWDGKNLTTTIDVGTFLEVDYWRKL